MFVALRVLLIAAFSLINKIAQSPSRFRKLCWFVVIFIYAEFCIAGIAKHMTLLHTSWIKGVFSLFNAFCF